MMNDKDYDHLMEAVGHTWIAWASHDITGAQKHELYEARVHLANAAMIEMEERNVSSSSRG